MDIMSATHNVETIPGNMIAPIENSRVGVTMVNADAIAAMRTVCDCGTMFGNDPRVRMYVRMSERHIRNVTSIWSGMERALIV